MGLRYLSKPTTIKGIDIAVFLILFDFLPCSYVGVLSFRPRLGLIDIAVIVYPMITMTL